MFTMLPESLRPICQNLLDEMFTKLHGQAETSVHKHMYCMYRADNGNKCAVGHIIPDDLYHPSMEKQSARVVLLEHKNLLQYWLGDLADDADICLTFVEWLNEAQAKLHDSLRTYDTIMDAEGNSRFRAMLTERTQVFVRKYGLNFKG